MATTASYASTPRVSTGTILAGDWSRTAPTQAATVFTAGASGSRIDKITAQVGGTSTASVLRLWTYNGSTYSLWQELPLLAVVPSGSTAGSLVTLNSNSSTTMPLIIPTGTSLRATIHDTQLLTQSYIDSLFALGTVNGVAAITTSRFTATAASTTAAAAAASPATTAFTLTASPYVPAVASTITLTSAGNASATNITLIGTDGSGAIITEVMAGPNTNTVYSTKVYTTLISAITSATPAATVSIGIAASVTFPSTLISNKITIVSAANASGITFTVRGVDSSGVTQTESITGGAAGVQVSSVNNYRGITNISSSGSIVTTMIGTQAFIAPVFVTALGGDF